jgi:gamma-glutamyltranspeptidase/glutathione hydrolase
MAETLAELAAGGEALIRRGKLAQAIVADQEARGGLLTAEDLESYAVQKRAAIRLPYREYEVLLPPPCSTGGVLTAFTLKLLSHFVVRRLDHGSAAHLRLLYEVQAATTRARPFWEKAVAEMESGDAVTYFLDDDFMAPFVAEVQEAVNKGEPSEATQEQAGPQNTSHLSVMDGDGMAVSLTTTAGESAGYVVPGTGFIPNNILGEEDLNPNGFHQWPSGERIATMMTPLFVAREGKIRLVTGSGGSNRIRSAILQTLSNLLDFGMPLDEAVNAARVHLQDQVLQCELGHDPQELDRLEAWGYPVNRWSVRSIYFGGAHSVAKLDGGRLAGAGDNRRGGATAYV